MALRRAAAPHSEVGEDLSQVRGRRAATHAERQQDAKTMAASGDTKTLREYVLQPLQLLKEIERIVEMERAFYELDALRY